MFIFNTDSFIPKDTIPSTNSHYPLVAVVAHRSRSIRHLQHSGSSHASDNSYNTPTTSLNLFWQQTTVTPLATTTSITAVVVQWLKMTTHHQIYPFYTSHNLNNNKETNLSRLTNSLVQRQCHITDMASVSTMPALCKQSLIMQAVSTTSAPRHKHLPRQHLYHISTTL